MRLPFLAPFLHFVVEVRDARHAAGHGAARTQNDKELLFGQGHGVNLELEASAVRRLPHRLAFVYELIALGRQLRHPAKPHSLRLGVLQQ
jgi:hypothetical protein